MTIPDVTRTPDFVGTVVRIVPPDAPFLVEDFKNDRTWCFPNAYEANQFAAALMASDPSLSGNINSDGWTA